jgi:hypothetical protein
MTTQHKRKYRRFALRFHVRLAFHSGGQACQIDAFTHNVSAGGLLLESPSRIPSGGPVTFAIMADGKEAICPMVFVGEGKVVRTVLNPAGPGFAIALKSERPLEYHPAKSRSGSKSSPGAV